MFIYFYSNINTGLLATSHLKKRELETFFFYRKKESSWTKFLIKIGINLKIKVINIYIFAEFYLIQFREYNYIDVYSL